MIEITEERAVVAAEIADEIGPQGPQLAAVDALVAAIGRELGAAVVSSDSDLTHEETKNMSRSRNTDVTPCRSRIGPARFHLLYQGGLWELQECSSSVLV